MSLVYFGKILEILETSPQLKKTFKGIARQMCWGAGGTVVGGVLGGPPGALLGGILGAFYGYATVDEYDSLLIVLRNLSEEEKYRLQLKVQELVGSNLIEDLVRFVQSEVNRQLLLGVISGQVKGA